MVIQLGTLIKEKEKNNTGRVIGYRMMKRNGLIEEAIVVRHKWGKHVYFRDEVELLN